MTDAEHNRKQESKALAELQKAIADALRIDFRGTVGIRIPVQRRKLGNVRLITEQEK